MISIFWTWKRTQKSRYSIKNVYCYCVHISTLLFNTCSFYESALIMSCISVLSAIGVPPSPGVTPGGAGWSGQRVRFLHTARSYQRFYYQSRSLHDTVVARLSPEDIKKAREAKQAQVKPVRQKVSLKTISLDYCALLYIFKNVASFLS